MPTKYMAGLLCAGYTRVFKEQGIMPQHAAASRFIPFNSVKVDGPTAKLSGAERAVYAVKGERWRRSASA
jgi:hypothetical protein